MADQGKTGGIDARAAASWLSQRGCLFWVVVIVAALWLLAKCSPDDPAPDRAALLAGPAQVVGARELYAAYQANEVAAQQQYGNGPVEVTGTIDGISLSITDDPVIRMLGGGPAELLSVNFDKSESASLAALAQGQQVTVRCGKVRELLGMPVLSGCVVTAP